MTILFIVLSWLFFGVFAASLAARLWWDDFKKVNWPPIIYGLMGGPLALLILTGFWMAYLIGGRPPRFRKWVKNFNQRAKLKVGWYLVGKKRRESDSW